MNSSKTYDKPYDYEEDKYDNVNPSAKTTIELRPGEELRIELDLNNGITVSLVEGFAEIFGAELPPETPVYYPPMSKFAIFTWHKAKIVITGCMETHYTSLETQMEPYLEVHAAINEDRDNAKAERKPGPNIIVTGSADSGKSTLCKILINYALKMGYKPIFIDLDIESNEIVPSGCIGAAKIKLPLPNDDLNEDTVCMYNGYTISSMIKDLYKTQVKKLSEVVNERIKNKQEEYNKEYVDLGKNDQVVDALKTTIDPYTTSQVPSDLGSGCLINAMLYSKDTNLNTIKFIAKNFKADYIIVIDYEKLYRLLYDTYKDDMYMKLVKLPASSGVVDADEMHKQALKNQSFKNYFLGKTLPLSTFEIELSLTDYTLFIVDILTIPISALPTGATEDATKVIVKRLDPNEIPMQNKVIGILDPQDVDKLIRIEKDIETGGKDSKEEFYNMIITSLCRGLIHVNFYDSSKNNLIVNSPTEEGPRSKYLMIGDLSYERE